MTPTGVPLKDVRERLFDSAARVLLRDGPSGLTSRAVTTEAGLAKGILHRYFADFDAFLAAFVGTRLDLLDVRSAELRATAGEATVAENLASALGGALDPVNRAAIALVVSRRALLERLRVATPEGVPLAAEVVRMIAAYLTAERGLGRIALDIDVDRLALALVGAALLAEPGADAVADLCRALGTGALPR
jgi:AcrR family transcriptional regulator